MHCTESFLIYSSPIYHTHFNNKSNRNQHCKFNLVIFYNGKIEAFWSICSHIVFMNWRINKVLKCTGIITKTNEPQNFHAIITFQSKTLFQNCYFKKNIEIKVRENAETVYHCMLPSEITKTVRVLPVQQKAGWLACCCTYSVHSSSEVKCHLIHVLKDYETFSQQR